LTTEHFDHLISVAPERGFRPRRRPGRRQSQRAKISMRPISTVTSPIRRWKPRRLAQIEGDKAPSGFNAKSLWRRDQIAHDRVSQEKVRVITPFVGGGFAGRHSTPRRLRPRSWPSHRQNRCKSCGPVRKIFLRYLPSGGRRQNQFRRGCRRQNGFWINDVYFAGERGAQQFYSVRIIAPRRAGRFWWRTGAGASLWHRRWRAPATTPTPSPRIAH